MPVHDNGKKKEHIQSAPRFLLFAYLRASCRDYAERIYPRKHCSRINSPDIIKVITEEKESYSDRRE